MSPSSSEAGVPELCVSLEILTCQDCGFPGVSGKNKEGEAEQSSPPHPQNMFFEDIDYFKMVIFLKTKDSERTFGPSPYLNSDRKKLLKSGRYGLSIIMCHHKSAIQGGTCRVCVERSVSHCLEWPSTVYYMFALSHLPANCLLSLWSPRPLLPPLSLECHISLNCSMCPQVP